MRAGRLGLLPAVAALLVLVAGCGRKSEPKDSKPTRSVNGDLDAPRRGGTLVLGLQQEPEIFCSILQVTKSERIVNNCLFSRFVTWDDSLRLVPDLITDVPTGHNGGISPDNLTYTYHLRRDARWHDGVPVTSADVRFTYDRIMDSECGAESQQGFDIVDRLDTPDAHTIIFHLREPYASFVSDTFSDEDVLPKHLLEKEPCPGFRDAAFHRAPIGSGPFRFVEWHPASHIRLARFEGHHGGDAWLDELVFRIVPDANALAVQLQGGALMGYDQAEGAQLPMLEKLPGIRIYKTPSLAYEQLAFQCDHPILSDVRVRRALAHATNRDAIAAGVYGELAQPARADMHPLSPWYEPAADTMNAYDPKRARSLLEAAGWRDANGDGIRDQNGRPLRLEITTTAGRPARERTEVLLQQQWRDVGVDLVVRNYNAAVLFGSGEEGRLRSGRFEVALFGWGQPPDPAAIEVVYGSSYIPPEGQNMGRFRNAAFDSLARLGTRVAAMELRVQVYRSLERVLLEQVPVVPLAWLMEADPMTVRLREYRPNPSSAAGDTWNVHRWWLAEPAS